MITLPDKLITKAARLEDASAREIKKGIADGTIVVLKNNTRGVARPCAVGKGMTTKVNANIGLSSGNSSVALEMKKMNAAVEAGADTVMDLSTGSSIRKLRRKILGCCPVPVGTVPIYDLACGKKKEFRSLGESDFVDVLEKQADEGVDFFTIHAGITIDAARFAVKKPRVISIVSRGGALLASWMLDAGRENPFLTQFDRVMEIAKRYSITLSLGDSLRPGAIQDATDHLQIQELLVLGRLQQRAMSRGVQVMIEGPGHMPLDQIEMNVKLQKKICHGSPFYVLGPLVTDAAPGYDHITSAIGGAVAAWHGADFLCYVTPAEHVKLPDVDDVKKGVIASKIAAHAADIVKGIPSAARRDLAISKARAKRDWKTQFRLSLDPELPKKMRLESQPTEEDVCAMCAEFCSIKMMEEGLGKKSARGKK
ncbi:MAG: phosphomethylpyrimidine synthase ThiC [Candidatus Omnitrophica bacterium]|nr:phosphomethylpyrimidine synthase ThiC [Candidatus Omnitrophota bacterium]MBU1128766.1 phosphomethylpyrimidine synthase ThiC [Candidatus Omnitrophota bacterium]MBU1785233.1 phosphomethylpyrimidine synthase ThiC [Candidatus Omnitrophota bacterium]MBU1851241.1 phosphomethylpyrimidine synthase ThiC [Candidatus Omnitrophota bacterium]